ncbi:MICOS complex subunit MIC27-like isoform X2 [Saccoglossus kowalevskii]
MVLLLPMVRANEMDDRFKLKPKELPIYEGSFINSPEYKFELQKTNAVQDAISVCRQRVWKVAESMQGTIDKTKEVCNKTQSVSKDVIEYAQTEEGIVPRLVAISMAGVLGVFLGAKGGTARKLIYAGGLMTATASLCYPKQSVEIAQKGYRKTADKAIEIYEQQKTKRSQKKTQSSPPKKVESRPAPVKAEQPSTPKVDHGQSKPEDKDMYTTRG